MPDVRVFVSFDQEHDRDLCDAMIEQSRRSGSGFAISAQSEARDMNDPWEERQRLEIRSADQIIVVCGEHTGDSLRMSAELRIVHEEDKPYFLLWGRRASMCTRPSAARPRDSMYSWTTEILRNQIDYTRRASEPVPERLKRAARPTPPPEPAPVA